MRNVIVFTTGGTTHAVELRWVRDIVRLGWLTPIPGAPSTIAGAVQVRGAVIPVLGASLLGGAVSHHAAATPQAGDTLLLVDAEGTQVALSADRIDEVTTLEEVAGDPTMLVGRGGLPIPIVDPPALLAAATRSIAAHVTAPRGAVR
ncbi:MAG: chemotaxis protein CheW [Myxococcales bacterium]|nr:chemotaxis protein CheW [Myxococcales bacterium]